MSRRSLWARIAAGTAVALGSVVLVPVPAPTGVRAPTIVAIALGTALGVLLFVSLAATRPRLPGRAHLTVTQLLFVVGWACVEEALWRRLLLGGVALAAGALAGLAVATALFALAHRQGRRSHILTGAAFGSAYIATGRLGAAIASHVAYNLLVAGSRSPPTTATAP